MTTCVNNLDSYKKKNTIQYGQTQTEEMKMQEPPPDFLAESPKQHKAGRRCECGRYLARLNPGPKCFTCQPQGLTRRDRNPVVLRAVVGGS